MNHQEEDLQRNIEMGLDTDGDHADIKAYRKVFRVLTRPPEITLPDTFADRVVTRVLERKTKRTAREYLWFALGVSLLVISCIVAAVMTGFTVQLGFLRGISTYSGVFLFGIVFIFFLNRLDRKLVTGKKEDR